MASLTVISLSRLIISWISDATMYFVSFAYGFVPSVLLEGTFRGRL